MSFDNDIQIDISLFDYIGFFGPIIVIIISVIKLWNQQQYFIGYIVFKILNSIINSILKSLIREKRPSGGLSIINEKYTGSNIYGMPSSHTQAVAYSTIFLYLVKKSSKYLILESFILALTFYQRWKYKRHTIEQLCIGTGIGALLGYIGFYVTKISIQKT
jgi:membrane-associated phospholipid phosphatase